MKGPIPYFVISFAIFPLLVLYSSNMGLIAPNELILPATISISFSVLLSLAMGALCRNLKRGALLSSFIVLSYFVFGHVWLIIRSGDMVTKHTVVNYSIAVVAVGLLLLLAASRGELSRVTRFLNTIGVLLLVVPTLSIGMQWIAVRRQVSDIQFLSGDARTRSETVTRGRPPDIYYIILDGFGRQDTLKKYLQFDGQKFVDALQQRGFYIASGAHSNYIQTELSLASSLNFDYLQRLLPGLDKESTRRQLLDVLIDRNRVSAILKSKGYSYLAIGTGFPGVSPRSADIYIHGSEEVSLFWSLLLEMSPFEPSFTEQSSQFDQHRNALRGAVSALKNLQPEGLRPRFVFAHILAPHPPFVLNADGSDRKSRSGFGFYDGSDFFASGATRREYVEGYTNQAAAISMMLLNAIDSILTRSGQRPIILIQGDHGSKLNLDQSSLAKTNLEESFSNLSAYLVPESVRQRLYPTITPVNSFRVVFDGLFNESLPLLPDKSYYSTWGRPFDWIDITSKLEAR